MKYPKIDHPVTGTAVPLASIKTSSNMGIGEFPDLVHLGQWCQQTGLELIQLLPLNDTGYETSPYNALSAFALHPVYLRLQDIPGAQGFEDKIQGSIKEYNQNSKVRFKEILKTKLELLEKIFLSQREKILGDPDFVEFLKANSWVPEYAVFMTLKQRNEMAGWQQWPSFQKPKSRDIKKFWEEEEQGEKTRFYAWLQWQAHTQFSLAVTQIEKMGISLKGDIPIMINEDSADVWAHPELFSLELRAGAPPDGMDPQGQNWGFPIYNWDEHRKTKFKWWKQRLKVADQYYHAFRIDHVLGFFRIWATPQVNTSGALGYFLPSEGFSQEELFALGWDEGRLRWMSCPHLPGSELRDALGDDSQSVIHSLLDQIPGEDLYLFKPQVQGEKDIWDAPIPKEIMGKVADFFRNITLIHATNGQYFPQRHYHGSRGYQSMSPEEKHHFDQLIHIKGANSAILWEQQGRELMDLMRSSTKMMVCAEDLGSIPDCVPRVLQEKDILGLKIVRWARNWDAPGQPYFPVRQYPLLSVCTPAVHDTSTLRQWWGEEGNKSGFFQALDLLERMNETLTPDIAKDIIQSLLETSSLLCIFQIQDLFSLTDHLRTADPVEERINTPGTVNEVNWNYKILPSLESLMEDKVFNQQLFELISNRRKKSLKINLNPKKGKQE